MVDFDRGYYADLQLDGPTDDERLIRAQYRKLYMFARTRLLWL